MAERTSGMSSRRNTPQPGPKPIQKSKSRASPNNNIRVTRSQSRDISDSEGALIGFKIRRSEKQASSKDESSVTGKNTLKGRKNRPIHQSRALQELSMVAEDQSVVYPHFQSDDNQNVNSPLEVQDSLQRKNMPDTKSPGGVSAFSGTTARTSRSALESANLDAEDALDAFPALVSSSDGLLRFLVPDKFTRETITSIRRDVQSKETRACKNFLRLGKTFQVQRDVFGSDLLLDPLQIVKALTGTKDAFDLPPGSWRPDSLLQKTNFAVLASYILTSPRNAENETFWQELDHEFPRHFLGDSGNSMDSKRGQRSLSQETFHLALEIRTQYVIMLLRGHLEQINFDFDLVIKQVFFTELDNLRGWDLAGFRSEDLTHDAEDAITQRIHAIRHACKQNPSSESGADIDIVERVSNEFPWDDFIYQSIHWIRKQLDEIGIQIARVGGADAILRLLTEEVQKRRAAGQPVAENQIGSPKIHLQYETPPDISHTPSEMLKKKKATTNLKQLRSGPFSANSPKSKSLLKHLKDSEARGEALSATGSAEASKEFGSSSFVQVAPSLEKAPTPDRPLRRREVASSGPAKISDEIQQDRDDDWQPQQDAVENDGDADDDDDNYYGDANLDVNPPEIARRVRAIRHEREAESNKENLVEVPGPQIGRAKSLLDPQSNAKSIEFDSPDSQYPDSQNEDFQAHRPVASSSKSTKTPNKRFATAPLSEQRASPKKTRLQRDSPLQDQHDNEFDILEGYSGPRRPQERPPQPSQIQTYHEANSSAKERVALPSRKVQVRRPWTDDETNALLDLITQYGTSWARLKKEDGRDGKTEFLGDRDQVALKDKARNMKLDFLLSSRHLPVNFEHIALSKLQIDRLQTAGIAYDKVTGHRVDGQFDAIVDDGSSD